MSGTDPGRAFFDTNVLVYLFDAADPVKQQQAQSLLRDTPPSSVVVSAQVLGELYWATTRKLATPLAHDAARSATERVARFAVVPVDKELVRGALGLVESESLAYWDALIVEAANVGACHRLLTEDLNHGQVIKGVRIEDPFRGAADASEQ